MSLIYSTVDCAEVFGTRREDADLQTGYACSVTLEVSAANKDALVEDLLFNQRECPFITNPVPPTARRCSVVPVTTQDQPPVDQGYGYAIFHVTVSYSNEISTLIVEEIEPVAEFLRLDHRMFRWASDTPLTEGEAPGLLYQTLNLNFKYFNQTLVPIEVISGIGKVHNASWTSPTLGLTFASETLLYCPAPLSSTTTTSGSSGFNYSTKFAYRPNGWNKYWRPLTQSWEAIYLPNGTQYKSYIPANLAAILP